MDCIRQELAAEEDSGSTRAIPARRVQSGSQESALKTVDLQIRREFRATALHILSKIQPDLRKTSYQWNRASMIKDRRQVHFLAGHTVPRPVNPQLPEPRLPGNRSTVEFSRSGAPTTIERSRAAPSILRFAHWARRVGQTTLEHHAEKHPSPGGLPRAIRANKEPRGMTRRFQRSWENGAPTIPQSTAHKNR